MKNCLYCGILIGGQSTHKGLMYTDGRCICDTCHYSAVKNNRQIEVLWLFVEQSMNKLGYFISLKKIPVRVLDNLELSKQFSTTDNVMGLTITKMQVGHMTNEVVMLYGVPMLHAIEVLAHEATHVYCREQKMRYNEQEEGFCQYVAYCVLEMMNTPEAKQHMKKMSTDSNPIYGGGFKENVSVLYKQEYTVKLYHSIYEQMRSHVDLKEFIERAKKLPSEVAIKFINSNQFELKAGKLVKKIIRDSAYAFVQTNPQLRFSLSNDTENTRKPDTFFVTCELYRVAQNENDLIFLNFTEMCIFEQITLLLDKQVFSMYKNSAANGIVSFLTATDWKWKNPKRDVVAWDWNAQNRTNSNGIDAKNEVLIDHVIWNWQRCKEKLKDPNNFIDCGYITSKDIADKIPYNVNEKYCATTNENYRAEKNSRNVLNSHMQQYALVVKNSKKSVESALLWSIDASFDTSSDLPSDNFWESKILEEVNGENSVEQFIETDFNSAVKEMFLSRFTIFLNDSRLLQREILKYTNIMPIQSILFFILVTEHLTGVKKQHQRKIIIKGCIEIFKNSGFDLRDSTMAYALQWILLRFNPKIKSPTPSQFMEEVFSQHGLKVSQTDITKLKQNIDTIFISVFTSSQEHSIISISGDKV